MYKDENGKIMPGKPPKAKASGKEDSAYRERAKNEQKRLEDNVRDDFWLCVCFKTDKDRMKTIELLGLQEKKHYRAEEFLEALKPYRPEKTMRTFPRKPKSNVKTPNPRDGLEFPIGKLEDAFIAEADAILNALRTVERPEPCREVTDSDIWFTVVFDNGQSREDFLNGWNLGKYGDRYMDGTAWLKALTK